MNACDEDAQRELADIVYAAAKKAFFALFGQHQETFYYCSLTTDGLVNGPALTAWSWEALERTVDGDADPEEARKMLKWSYGESPYFCFGDEWLEPVRQLFQKRPGWAAADWESEATLRFSAMEMAMRRLDTDGVFGCGAERLNVVINVEVVPPDHTNTERALRLNPPEAMKAWLAENDNS